MRIPLDRLLIKPNVSAGCNYLKIAAFTLTYRSTTEDLDPVTVRDIGEGLYRIQDGRHRYLASIIAGRHDLLCELETFD